MKCTSCETDLPFAVVFCPNCDHLTSGIRGMREIQLAIEHGAKGDYSLAIELLTEVLELKPTIISTYRLRAGAFFDNAQYEEAIEDATKMLNKDPEDKRMLSVRGQAYCYIKKYDDGLRDLTKLIFLDPENEKAYRMWDLLNNGAEDYDRSMLVLTQEFNVEPFTDDELNVLANSHFKSGAHEEPEEFLSILREHYPDNPTGLKLGQRGYLRQDDA